MAKGFFGWIKQVFSSDESGTPEKESENSKKGPDVSKKPKGLSIHIGINSVDPNHYKKKDGTGWDGALNACEQDAKDMAKIANENGFESEMILTKAATRDKIRQTITNASQKLNKGDILMVSYSGHGGQIPDYSGDEAEVVKGDEIDETWCLYDGQLLDDELNVLWSKFKKGVRILVFSDSCHSGTVTRATDEEEEDDEDSGKSRAMPWDEAIETYRNNSDFYNGIGENTPSSAVDVPAAVLLISGCQDEQLSREGMINGRFTGNLKRVLKEGDFKNYKEFHQKIVDRMPDNQTPNYFGQGDFAEFEAERPFTI